MTQGAKRLLGVFGLLLVLSAPAASQTTEDATASWSDIDAPGTPEGFASAAGLNEAFDPAGLLIRWVRVRDLPTIQSESRAKDVEQYLRMLERVKSGSALLGSDISLASGRRERSRFESLLSEMGLALDRRKGEVTSSPQPAAEERRSSLTRAGVDVERIQARWNAGETAHIDVPSFKVMLPLSRQWWRQTVFSNRLAPESLFQGIVEDASASLLYYALASSDSETRQFFRATPKLANWLRKGQAALFVKCAGHFRVRNGEVDVPGGGEARNLWEALVGVEVTRPERFLESLIEGDAGHLVEFYSAIDALDLPQLRFALGLYPNVKRHSPRSWIRALYEAWFAGDSNWSYDGPAFVHPSLEPSVLLSQIVIGPSGLPRGPVSESLWKAAFDSIEIPQERFSFKEKPEPLTAPVLIELALQKAERTPDRIDAFLFAQRVFHDTDQSSAPDIVIALRGFRRFRMLHLTLERLGVRDPAIHADAARRAARLSDIGDPDVLWATLSQFQGALALIDRAKISGRLTDAQASALVRSLIDVKPQSNEGYGIRLAVWLEESAIPALSVVSPDGPATIERAVLAGAFGLTPASAGRPFEARLDWEGSRYLLSPAQGRFTRAMSVRAQQHVNSIDDVTALARACLILENAVSPGQVAEAVATLNRLQGTLRDPRPPERLTDAKLATVSQALNGARRELQKIKNFKQVKKAPRAAEFWLEPLVASLTADLMRTVTYALHLPDASTPLLSGGDVSHLHDLGLRSLNSAERERAAWSQPTRLAPESGRTRLKGALLGVDIALGELVLNRVPSDVLPVLSFWPESAQRQFGQSVALFNPLDPRLADTPKVAAAIRAGRTRVDDLKRDRQRWQEVADAARLAPLRYSLLERAVIYAPQSLDSFFSMMEFLRLGGDEDAIRAADAWGSPAVALNGCLCLALPPAVDWDLYSGRREATWLAAGSPDLLLRLAEVTSELKLPPAIVADLLPFGVRSLLDSSRLDRADDWMSVSHFSSTLPQRTIEDYMARVTIGWSLVALAPAD